MTDSPPQPRSEAEIRTWLVHKLSSQFQLDPAQLPLDEPLVNLGIDSMQFVVLVGELEEWLGCKFKDNPLIDYPTLNALSGFLARQVQAGKTVIDPAHPE